MMLLTWGCKVFSKHIRCLPTSGTHSCSSERTCQPGIKFFYFFNTLTLRADALFALSKIKADAKKFTRETSIKCGSVFGGSCKTSEQRLLQENPQVLIATPGEFRLLVLTIFRYRIF